MSEPFHEERRKTPKIIRLFTHRRPAKWTKMVVNSLDRLFGKITRKTKGVAKDRSLKFRQCRPA